MRRTALLLASLLLCCAVVARRNPPKRPRILGIAGATILVSNVADARNFYLKLVDPNHVCNYCEEAPSRFLFLPSGQRITLEKVSDPLPANLLAEVSFLTEDLEGFKRYLHANKIEFGEVRQKHGGELIRINLQDPEGHHISITDSYHLANADDLSAGLPPSHPSNPVRIIHAGFIVNDRAAADHFYQDLLGFHLYWHGGMKDDETSWVAMQVPDGTDWVEYMLNIPPTADKHTRGVMNHISLGVPDIHVAEAQISKAGIKPTEQPQIGRDGKWQLNLYDADDTRVEFMEFTPVQKPCCSEFAGTHPGPKL
jgi:catechol 2,3-dioxygenase-like lactoylglutathione lyase family enzyme